MTPKRIQLSRAKGWRKPEGAVVVARPSKWGNPVKVGPEFDWHVWGKTIHSTVQDAAEAVEYYRLWIDDQTPDERLPGPSHAEIRRELAGRDLACWCPLDQPCHADVLLEVANA